MRIAESDESGSYPAVFLTDGTTMITLWQAENPADAVPFNRKNVIRLHHFALKVDGAHALNALHDKLSASDGVEVEFGDTHGDVDSLLEHVDDPVDEHGHERDVGVAVQQIEQDRRQHHAAEQHRGRHRDRAAGFGMESGGVPVCLLDRGEDGAAVSKITLAGVSQYLLRALDERAAATGISRSALLAQGARRVLDAN